MKDTISSVMHPPENFYHLIPREEVKSEKAPRYMSQFREQVKQEQKLNKASHRTMGPAKVEVSSPDKFLKKHSKEPKLPEMRRESLLLILYFATCEEETMEEIRKQFKRIRKFVRRRLVRLSNSERDALIQKLQDNMQNMAKDMNSLIILMAEKKVKEREDKQHLQNITKPESSLQRYEYREKTVAHEKERERWAREQKQLEERVGHLEAALDFEKRKWEQKAKLEKERNTLQLETIRELQRSLKHSEERRENAQHESDLLMNVLEQLDERVVQLEATLASEQEKRQHNQEMTYLDTKFSNETPNMSNKSQTISDKVQEMRMGSHGRLVEYFQMFRNLASDLDNHEDEKQEISLDMDLRNALLQQTIAKLKSSSNCHLEQKTAAQESKDSVEL
ncbi:enkurin [Silurus meridionalis]|nr:enkurin [Silurus meridionalis]